MRVYITVLLVAAAGLCQVLGQDDLEDDVIMEKRSDLRLVKRGGFGFLCGYLDCNFEQDNNDNPWQFVDIGHDKTMAVLKKDSGGIASMSVDYTFKSSNPYAFYYPKEGHREYDHFTIQWLLLVNETDRNTAGMDDCYVEIKIMKGGQSVMSSKRSCEAATIECGGVHPIFVKQSRGSFRAKNDDLFTFSIVAKTGGANIYVKYFKVNKCRTDTSNCKDIKNKKRKEICENMKCKKWVD